MRIAIIVHDYHRQGGHSRYVAELAERFAREHEVHVFANRFPAGAKLFPQPAMEGLRLYFQPVYAQRSTAIGTVLSFFLPATLAVWRQGPFDVVHGQGFVCAQSEILTAHICCAAWHEQRVRSGYQLSWKEQLFDSVVTRLEGWQYSRSPQDPLIAISRRVAADLKQFYERRINIEVIAHGVDCREFDIARRADWRTEVRNELGLGEDVFTALWVGDLRKGAKAAIEAVAQNPCQMLLAVSRNDPRPFEDIATTLGVAERVRFLPPTNQIARYYAAADAFVFPTTYDAFGMVVLEAMAMGCPVIVSRDAGAAELIADGRDGLLLADPFDASESAAYLRRLELDRAWRIAIAAAGVAKAQMQSWDAVAAATMQIYRRLGQ